MTQSTAPDPLDQLPRWLPAATYALLTVLVFRAYFLAPSGSMIYGSDTIAAGVMFRSFFVNAVRALGHIPQWNPYLFSGLPYVEAGGGDTLYPTAILHFVMSMPQALAWKLIVHVFVAGFAMYYCVRVFGGSRWTAYVAGGAYLLSAQLISQVFNGQDTKLYCTAIFPLALGFLVRGVERRSLIHFVWLGLVAGLLLIGHPILSFYAWATLGVWALGLIWVRRSEGVKATLQRLGGGVAALAVGIGIAAVILFPMYHYLRNYSPRSGSGKGFDYAANYALHWPETVGLFVGGFAGTDATTPEPTYWGPNPLKGNLEFGGALVFVLGVAAAFGLRDRDRRPAIALAATAFIAWVYAMGTSTPFFRLVYDLVPPTRSFRAPSLSMFLFFVPVTILAALLLDRALRGGTEGETARTVASRALLGGAIAGVLLGLIVQGAGATGISGIFGPLDQNRLGLLEANLDRMIVGSWLTALCCGVLWFMLRGAGKGTLPARGVLVAFLVLTSADLLHADTPFVQVLSYAQRFPTDDPAMDWYRSQLGPGERVLPSDLIVGQGTFATYGIPEVFGYHGNEPRWYDVVTLRVIRDNYRDSGDAERYNGYLLQLMTSGLGRLLSARLAILPATNIPITGWTRVAGNQTTSVYRNDRALPGGAAVGRIVVQSDTAQVIQGLWDPSFDPSAVAFTAVPVPGLTGTGGTGTFQITSESSDSVAATVTSTGPVLALLSRTWHPYWGATVDGQSAPVIRTDYAFIGVPVTTAGIHHLVFRYRSPVFEHSALASEFTWALVLLATLAVGIRALRRSTARG